MAFGKPGPAGVGGVLRDMNGRVRGMFSVNIGVADSNFAELYAILEALELFMSFEEGNGCGLFIESDSSNAVSWVNEANYVCWRYEKIQ